MTRRGLKPTGIAIYDAMEQGFKSVGHLLQSQLQKKGGIAALCGGGRSGCGGSASMKAPAAAPPAEAEGSATVAAAAAGPSSSSGPHTGEEQEAAAAATPRRGTRGRPPKAPQAPQCVATAGDAPVNAALDTAEAPVLSSSGQTMTGEATTREASASKDDVAAAAVVSVRRPRGIDFT